MYRMLPERKVLVKLIDFGQMQWKRGDAAGMIIRSTDKAAKEGTALYLSPARMHAWTVAKDDECDKEKPCPVVSFDAQKDDVWAVGLMLLSMLSPGTSRQGRKILVGEKALEYLNINNKEWRELVDDAVSPKRARLLWDAERSVNAEFVHRLQEVLKGMLEPNEAARPTAAEAYDQLWHVMTTASPYGQQDLFL